MNPRITGRANPDHELIVALDRRLDEALEGLIPLDRPYALLDFPHAPNVGDSLIWLGQRTWFERQGYGPPCYTCSSHTYSPDVLRRRIGDGTIVLSGGGNFGDLYPTHQDMRESVLRDFPDHAIVQLPQTIHFDAPEAQRASAEAFAAHPRVIVLVRDEDSYRTATESLGVNARLCPDMAFSLGPMAWRTPSRSGILWMRRQDKESASTMDDVPPRGVRMIEWLDDWRTPLLSLNMFIARQLRYRPALRRPLQSLLSATYSTVARQRVERGCRIIGTGRYVITDRLHGHILAMLMGIPHAVLDNAYGKVRRFHACWTSESRLAEWCDSEEEALARAQAFTARPRPVAA